MIKLTDEQVELLQEQLNSQGGSESFNHVGDFEEYVWSLSEILGALEQFLTLPQIKQLAEDAGMYCGEWIEIQADTSSVINSKNKECLALMKDNSQELCVYENGVFIDGNGYGANCNDGITHISLKPTLPKE